MKFKVLKNPKRYCIENGEWIEIKTQKKTHAFKQKPNPNWIDAKPVVRRYAYRNGGMVEITGEPRNVARWPLISVKWLQ